MTSPSLAPAHAEIRRLARRVVTNDLIFDLLSPVYDWMTHNPIWLGNSARLLDAAGAGDGRLRVLDLGAGPGNSALAMGQRHPHARFLAYDLAGRMVLLARHNRVAAGWPAERLVPVQGDAVRLPLASASVDAVTAHSFLYLLPDAHPVLVEAHRVLRPGGVISVLEPRAGGMDWGWLWARGDVRLMTSLSLWRVYSWIHRRYSAGELTATLAAAGFQDIATEETLGGFGIFGRGHKA